MACSITEQHALVETSDSGDDDQSTWDGYITYEEDDSCSSYDSDDDTPFVFSSFLPGQPCREEAQTGQESISLSNFLSKQSMSFNASYRSIATTQNSVASIQNSVATVQSLLQTSKRTLTIIRKDRAPQEAAPRSDSKPQCAPSGLKAFKKISVSNLARETSRKRSIAIRENFHASFCVSQMETPRRNGILSSTLTRPNDTMSSSMTNILDSGSEIHTTGVELPQFSSPRSTTHPMRIYSPKRDSIKNCEEPDVVVYRHTPSLSNLSALLSQVSTESLQFEPTLFD